MRGLGCCRAMLLGLHGMLLVPLVAQEVSFARDVLPILSDRCFACHGPDAGARKAELRLDVRDDVLRPRDGYAIVRPGDPAASELFARISAAPDADKHMPPSDSKLSLSEAEVEVLRRWIESGAKWSTHWAFAPIPAASGAGLSADGEAGGAWRQNGIDRFVFARLASDGMQPNTAASPSDLLRRVSLDLTGLPPVLSTVAAFEADPSDAHYRRIVEDLLASPHYGERMAWPWLEAARYADTDGFQADPSRNSWPWRDWLVRSLNQNVPFDRLTIEMLAGDLLADATSDQILATGFLRNNAHNGEGGRIAEETRIENGFDRTETVGTVWLGMTFECARCHDHKYDPISQRDYYRFFAFFDQSSETGGPRQAGALAPSLRYVGDEAARTRRDDLRKRLAAVEREMFGGDESLDRQQQEWELATAAKLRRDGPRMKPAKLSSWQRSDAYRGESTELFTRAFAPEPDGAPVAVRWQGETDFVDGAVLELPEGAYAVYFQREIQAATARRMRIALGSDDAIKVWCNGELVLSRDVRRAARPNQDRVEVALVAGQNRLLIKIVNTGGIGGAYFRVADEMATALPIDIARALLVPAAKRSTEQRQELAIYYRRLRQEGFGDIEARHGRLREALAEMEQGATTVAVMDELPLAKRRSTRMLARGSYQAPTEQVTAGVPSFLPPLVASGEPNRLALARWLVSGRNPLVARVAVNRAWQTFFGRGLVATAENFGRQGDRPTHPALLDWLARRLVVEGWDVKAMHRRIVTSATYRQSGAAAKGAFANDPENRLLARYPRRRMPAWMLRDQALALSGRLVDRIGGKPVMPYQPAGIWDEATFGLIKYQQGKGDDLYRRSLYTFWRRIVGPTVLFDTPSRLQCVVRRSITNTPLHALTTLNETGYIESARGLAVRATQQSSISEKQIEWLFRAATARRPEPREMRVLQERWRSSLERFEAGDLDTAKFLAIGDSAQSSNLDANQLAALAVVASLVLNLDEVVCLP